MRSLTILLLIAVYLPGLSQVPNKFNYQAVARNSLGQFIPNANINLRLTLLKGSASGTAMYSETRKVTTNNTGLFSVVIGSTGATATTGNFATIDWSTGNVFLKVEADPVGGVNFTQMGSTELVSVPYALYAVNGKKGDKGDAGPAGPAGPQGPAGPSGATTLALPYTGSAASAATPAFSVANTSATGQAIGLYGSTASTTGGGVLTSASGITGEALSTSGGSYLSAVKGINRSTTTQGIGVTGYHAGSGFGLYGEAPSGYGTYTRSTTGYGLYAISGTGTAAYFSSTTGLALVAAGGDVVVHNTLTAGRSSSGNTNNGINGYSSAGIGVYGNSTASAGGGVLAEGRYIGVQGTTTGTDPNRQAVRGENFSSPNGWAGVFVGNVGVFGTLSKSAGSFQIDHPLDPANKYLVHSFVESPDMKNIYDGIVTTDASGNASVQLPDYFQSLNIDYRYQLTCINQFAQAIVSREISNNRFSISTDKPNVKVSWQVTGIRNDPYAKENRLPVEKEKLPADRGKYLYPKGYGRGQEAAVSALRGVDVKDNDPKVEQKIAVPANNQ